MTHYTIHQVHNYWFTIQRESHSCYAYGIGHQSRTIFLFLFYAVRSGVFFQILFQLLWYRLCSIIFLFVLLQKRRCFIRPMHICMVSTLHLSFRCLYLLIETAHNLNHGKTIQMFSILQMNINSFQHMEEAHLDEKKPLSSHSVWLTFHISIIIVSVDICRLVSNRWNVMDFIECIKMLINPDFGTLLQATAQLAIRQTYKKNH